MAKRKTVRRTKDTAPEVPRPGPEFESPAEFEQFALAVLREEATAQERPFLTGSEAGPDYGFADAVAPRGIFDLPGPCVIEVKGNLSDSLLLHNLRRMIDSRTEIRSSLFVSNSPLIDVERLGQFARELAPFPVKILGQAELEGIAERHPDAVLPFRRERISQAIDAYLRRDLTTEAKRRDQYIAALRSAYNEDRLVLMLGAGVSMSARFPSWDALIQHLSVRFFDSHTPHPLPKESRDEIFDYFKSNIPASPLIVARLLKNVFGDDFALRVQESLYENSKGPMHDTSDLIRELAALCMPQRDRRGLTAVVSYNYDSLLEEELDRRGIKYHTLLSDNDESHRSELPIYHVHGYLPREGEITRIHEDALVLSEDSYHAQFIDSYLWSNLIQLNFLRANVCLLVGFSLTDPNQRRLLEITFNKKPNVRHYAILEDRWTGPRTEGLSETAQNFAKIFRGLEESSLERLGVSVIWFTDYGGIPRILAQIRS